MADFIKLKIDFRSITDSPGDCSNEKSDDYYLVDVQNLYIKLIKRPHYPTTFFRRTGDKIIFGYGSQDDELQDEFLVINFSRNRLVIKRDIYGSLPLFYSFEDSIFTLSNDYDWVMENTVRLTPNYRHLLTLMIPNPDIHDCLFEEISLLETQSTLVVKNNYLNISYRAIKLTTPSTDPRDFKKILEESLENFFITRISGQLAAFEVSGGIDSALLPLYSAGRMPDASLVASMIFPGEFGETQSTKLLEIQKISGLNSLQIPVDINLNPPLSRFNRSPKPFYSYSEIYFEALDNLAAELEQKGIKLISTGLGGDELFENESDNLDLFSFGEHEFSRRNKFKDYPPFVTEKFKKDYRAGVYAKERYQLPLMPISLIGSQLARNNIYISRGIWPVSPFINPVLLAFCNLLPVQFRANKNILKSYYSAKMYPEVIYNPVVNEHFGHFFNEAMQSQKTKELISSYSKVSAYDEMDLVSLPKLLDYYESLADNPPGNPEYLFNIYGWLCGEINLRSSKIYNHT